MSDTQLKDLQSLILVIPCFNEESRLHPQQWLDFLNENPSVQFLFVNDGSKDGTLSVLRSMERNKQVRVLNLEKNQGKAEAVRQGVLAALELKSAFVGFWDGDLATPLHQVQNFMRFYASHPQVDVVFGSRVKLIGKRISRKPLRHYLGRVFATAASSVLNLGIYDTQCGAKIFRVTSRLPTLFDEPFHSRWIFDVEILFRLKRGSPGKNSDNDLPLVELPLEEWTDVPGSKIKPSDFIASFIDLIRLTLKYK